MGELSLNNGGQLPDVRLLHNGPIPVRVAALQQRHMEVSVALLLHQEVGDKPQHRNNNDGNADLRFTATAFLYHPCKYVNFNLFN